MKAAYEYYQNSVRELRLQNQATDGSNGCAAETVVLTRAEQSLVNLFNTGQGHSLIANYANS